MKSFIDEEEYKRKLIQYFRNAYTNMVWPKCSNL